MLVTKVLSPNNVCIQKSKRSNPQVVHVDKLKLCREITPRTWLDKDESSDEEQEDDPCLPANDDDISDQLIMPVVGDGTIDDQKTDEHSLKPDQTATPDSGPTVKTEHVLDDDDGQSVRPKRTLKPPDHLRDFIVDRIPQADTVAEAGSPSTANQTPTDLEQLLTPEQADRLLHPWEAHAVWFRNAEQALYTAASFVFPAVNDGAGALWMRAHGGSRLGRGIAVRDGSLLSFIFLLR